MMREYGPSIAPKPQELVKAQAAVKKQVTTLVRAHTNEHSKYNFASTDQFYELVVGLMAEQDYVIDTLEAEDPKIWQSQTKKGDPVQWMRIKFLFVHSVPNATWSDPRAARTIAMQMTGPQSFMAAQSYADKAYLRSLFKIPIADVEVENMRADGTFKTDGGTNRSQSVPDVSNQSKRAIKSGSSWEDFEAIISDAPDLETLLDLERQGYSSFPDDWQMSVEEIVSRRKSQLVNGFQA